MSDRPLTNPGAQPPRVFAVMRHVRPGDAGGAARVVKVDRPAYVLGSAPRVHLALSSPLVSRSHAVIVCDENEVYLRDLGSRNHVFVNGKVVREAGLRPADLLRIGPYEFRCEKGF